MKTLLLISITLFTTAFWGQDYLDVKCTKDGSELSIEIENHNISGPTRIKFNSEIQNLTGVDLKGGLLQMKKGQFVLIWMSIPKDDSFTIKLESSDVADDILKIYYLVEGDRVTKEVKMSEKQLAVVEESNNTETEISDETVVEEDEEIEEDTVAEVVDEITEADRDETMEVEQVLAEDEEMVADKSSEEDEIMEEENVAEEVLEDPESEDETMSDEKREDTTTNKSQEDIDIEDEDPKTYKVPAIYRPLDINKNDEISADEINNAIDLFFDGEVDLSADDLNGLIDFFFEQE